MALAANGDRAKRCEGLAIAAAAFIPPAFLSWAFPEGGWAPFPTSAYLPIPAFAIICAILLPREQRALRWGVILYGLGATVALPLETPMGGNAVRLGALFGGPVMLCALWGQPIWRKLWLAPLLAAGFASLAFWMWSPAVRDVIKYLEDPAAKSDYFEPLRQFLYTLPDQRRIEIPFTRSHWEGAEIAPEVPLARGWLRQLDTGLNPIFYKGQINRLTYASWLADNAVRYVALPSAKPDKSSYGERALIEKGLPYLRLRWKSDDWRVYEVLLPAPIVIPQGDARIVLEQLGSDELLLDVKKPGEAIVKVRWTPYWYAPNACVEPDGDWTRDHHAQGRLRSGCRRASRRSGCSRAGAAATRDWRCYRSPQSSSASARSGCLDAPSEFAAHERGRTHGNWNREVVQRRQGLRLRHSGRARQGPVRAPHRHRRRGLPLARRGCARGVRGSAGRQGPQGHQRPHDLDGRPSQ